MAEPLTDEVGEETGVPGETPCDGLQKMSHTKARRFKPQARLEPALLHWWQASKADMLTVTTTRHPMCASETTKNCFMVEFYIVPAWV